jgi:hypothetical protein
LLAFAESEFRLSTPQEDGATLRDHLKSIHRQTRIMPEELMQPDLPDAAAHLWGYFAELSQDRMTPIGPQRITPAMLRDFQWMHGVQLDLWERRALRAIDQAFFANLPKGKR